MHITKNEPLAPYTTLRLGGNARFFARVTHTAEIEEALRFARAHSLPVLFLGGGSNLLVREGGFDGLVIKIETRGIEKKEAGDHAIYIVEAGEAWDAFVARTCSDGYWGVENLSGIPGTVGAAPVQNIGAYGVELAHTLVWVESIDTQTQTLIRYTSSQCQFAYRSSLFKKELNRYLIVRVACTLSTHATPQLTYSDVAEVFTTTAPRSPQDVREAILHIRAQKFPNLREEGSAGSFFLNPIVSFGVADALVARYPELPHFSVEGGVKLSLAWLLDHVLHVRGTRIGGARLFERQPLVIVTDTHATVADVLQLQKKITEDVETACTISLIPEVRII